MFKLVIQKELKALIPAPPMHYKARQAFPRYPDKVSVPDDNVNWNVEWPEYSPIEWTHDRVFEQNREKNPNGWADPPEISPENMLKKYTHHRIRLDAKGRPMNPVGRTGMSGRGILGNWGPNHAADPMVTRINPETNQFEMILIQRGDTKEWAIPGGMVDPGEAVSSTLKREFGEEALNTLEMTNDELDSVKTLIEELFNPKNAVLIYQGYVDDGRNTDNAWMETKAFHYHCTPELARRIKLHAGDDAAQVKWFPLNQKDDIERLFASHRDFVFKAIKLFEEKQQKEQKEQQQQIKK